MKSIYGNEFAEIENIDLVDPRPESLSKLISPISVAPEITESFIRQVPQHARLPGSVTTFTVRDHEGNVFTIEMDSRDFVNELVELARRAPYLQSEDLLALFIHHFMQIGIDKNIYRAI